MNKDSLGKVLGLHHLWLRGESTGRRANLSCVSLSGANLGDASLSHADLSGADLSGADLSHADLGGANLNSANLSDATLSGASLTDASLSDANLSGASLRGASLSGANLSDAKLFRASLSGADLRRANLSSADLRRASLSGASLPAELKIGTPKDWLKLLLEFASIVSKTPAALNMESWHCGSSHCGAGWVEMLHPSGGALATLIGTDAAACMLCPVPEFTSLFYSDGDEMLELVRKINGGWVPPSIEDALKNE